MPNGDSPELEITVDAPSAVWPQVQQRLLEWRAAAGSPAAVAFAGEWPASSFTPGRYRVTWSIRPLNVHTHEARVQLVPVAADPLPQAGKVHEMRAWIQDLEQAWAAKTPLHAGQRLDCTRDLRVTQQVMQSGHHAPRWLGDCTLLADKELLRPLSPGDVLLEADLREPVAIHRMDTVMATTHVGLIDIEVKALALDDATLGQALKIKPLGSNRVLNATATGPNAVNVK
jgi:flagella basal body P-ring formation protein FlgA